MSNDGKTDQMVDIVNFGILHHIAEWFARNQFDDMTQVDDEYILRRMEKLDCFTLEDVVAKRNVLAKKYNLPV